MTKAPAAATGPRRSATLAFLVTVLLVFVESSSLAQVDPAGPSPTAQARSAELLPNAQRPLTHAELLTFLGLPRSSHTRANLVVAEATILRGQPVRRPRCVSANTCVLGVLAPPPDGSGPPIVKARTRIARLFPADDSPAEGTFLFSTSRNGIRLVDPLSMPTGTFTVPIEPDALARAEVLPAGSLIAVEGWLSQVGRSVDCEAIPGDDEGSTSYRSSFIRCPGGWLLSTPLEEVRVTGTLSPAAFAIPVQPRAADSYGGLLGQVLLEPVVGGTPDATADPIRGITTHVSRDPATYLLRSVANPDPDAQARVGWRVVGRLEAVEIPDASAAADLPPGAEPGGLDWEPLADVHPPLDGRRIQTVAWADGFASIQAGEDRNLTAWRSSDGRTWERASLPLAIRNVGTLIAFRDGLVLTANHRGRFLYDRHSFEVWRSIDGLRWRPSGTFRPPTPRRFREYRQFIRGPWALDGRLVVIETYTNERCCGSSPAVFLAAQRERVRRPPTEYHTVAWVSRDGRRWTRQATHGLNGVDDGAGEAFGYLDGWSDGVVLASLVRSQALGRSGDGLTWRKDLPLPEAFDDTSPAVVARVGDGYVIAGESFDGGPGPGNWLTIWKGSPEGVWMRVFEHGQRSPDSIAVSGSVVVVTGTQLDPDSADLDETVYYPWVTFSTDGGATWDESLGWTGTVPMCSVHATASDDAIVLSLGCAPPGMATTWLTDLTSIDPARPRPAPSPSPSPSIPVEPMTSLPPAGGDWGPLAMVADSAEYGLDAGLGPGRLAIGGRCVTLRGEGHSTTLIWRDGETRWDRDTRQIIFADRDLGIIQLSDGERVTLGGAHLAPPDSPDQGAPQPRWLDYPDASCPAHRWVVHQVIPLDG
ncbi:hypothetical protein BH23CHL8_BH23CHL8_03310 [soil metagenome]